MRVFSALRRVQAILVAAALKRLFDVVQLSPLHALYAAQIQNMLFIFQLLQFLEGLCFASEL